MTLVWWIWNLGQLEETPLFSKVKNKILLSRLQEFPSLILNFILRQLSSMYKMVKWTIIILSVFSAFCTFWASSTSMSLIFQNSSRTDWEREHRHLLLLWFLIVLREMKPCYLQRPTSFLSRAVARSIIWGTFLCLTVYALCWWRGMQWDSSWRHLGWDVMGCQLCTQWHLQKYLLLEWQ